MNRVGPEQIQLRTQWTHRARRVVVKIGSGVLTLDGGLNQPALRAIAAQLAGVHATGRQVVVVSSGAVACGLGVLELEAMPRSIVDRQAAAAVGQQRLMQAWAEALSRSQIPVGQVLLTSDDLDHRMRYLNARHTIEALLSRGVIPIINENDSVSFEEIKLGDNDHLSALVASLIAADLLIMLTNVDGLRQGGPAGERITFVAPDHAIDEQVRPDTSSTGIGGMKTKVEAARLAVGSGIPVVVASGLQSKVVDEVLAGRCVGTFFEPKHRQLESRRHWIASAARARGTIIVDDGARDAIVQRGASLLSSGIVGVTGHYAAGAPVRICDASGQILARGLVSYSSDEIHRVAGRKSRELPAILGYTYMDEIVHRNDMVVERVEG